MYYSGNFYLSLEQMQTNAVYIRDWFINGWDVTINAVSAMLGNMQSESTINPAIWQNLDAGNDSLGYGLVQWTPATKYFRWCYETGRDIQDMDSALIRILYEAYNGLQWGNDSLGNPPPMTFLEFLQSELPPSYLAILFMLHYERPYNQNQPERGVQADYWFQYLTGIIPPVRNKKKMPIFMYLRQM